MSVSATKTTFAQAGRPTHIAMRPREVVVHVGKVHLSGVKEIIQLPVGVVVLDRSGFLRPRVPPFVAALFHE